MEHLTASSHLTAYKTYTRFTRIFTIYSKTIWVRLASNCAKVDLVYWHNSFQKLIEFKILKMINLKPYAVKIRKHSNVDQSLSQERFDERWSCLLFQLNKFGLSEFSQTLSVAMAE